MRKTNSSLVETDQPNSDDRRRFLITAMAGSGATITSSKIPKRWTRPVVSIAVIPAHAQSTSICSQFEVAVLTNDTTEGTVNVELETFGAPDGVEYEISFSATNNSIEGLTGVNDGQIENEGANEGFGSGNSNLEGTIEFMNELDDTVTNLEAELVFEGSSGLPNCQAETII